MSSKRKIIGRTLSPSTLYQASEPETFTQVFTLSTGKKATFSKITVMAADVETMTFVNPEINGRDQSALTPESLKDIIGTLKLQQFFPAIGVRHSDRIEILDGSRRRVAALLCRADLEILVTDEPLSATEARKLAKDIQTAREHNIREVGMRLLVLKNTGMSQKDIAKEENLSEAKVTRALQAASVSRELLSLFPIQAELTYSDYKALLKAEALLSSKNCPITQLIENISADVENVRTAPLLAEDEVKDQILDCIAKASTSMVTIAGKEKAVMTPLWQFDDKNKYARKKNQGRLFSYEFNRLSPELQAELDMVIQNTLEKHLHAR